MRLRSFTAPTMPAAMKQVRDALGDGAVILASENLAGKKGVRVTAAVEADDFPSPGRGEDAERSEAGGGKSARTTRPDSPSLRPGKGEDWQKATVDHLRFEIQNILRFHNLPELFVAKLMQKATDSELASILALHKMSATRDERHLLQLALGKLLGGFFGFKALELDPLPPRGRQNIMLVGPPGIGKTLTAAKIAARITMDHQKLAVATTDDKRAGGIEQLQAFTTILGLELRVATTHDALKRQAQSLSADTRLLVDTAGCNPYETAELRELKAYAALEGIEPVLVLPAGGDSLEAIDMVEAFMELPIKRLLITRADIARRLGGVLAAAAAHGLAFCNVSLSASIADPLHPLDANLLAQLLLRYQNQNG